MAGCRCRELAGSGTLCHFGEPELWRGAGATLGCQCHIREHPSPESLSALFPQERLLCCLSGLTDQHPDACALRWDG